MMRRIRASFSAFGQDEAGATTTEYGILIVVVAGVAIFALAQMNGAIGALYHKLASKINDQL